MRAISSSELLTNALWAILALASCCAAVFVISSSPFDDRYLDFLNFAVGVLLACFVAYRFVSGDSEGPARLGWVVASVAVGAFTLLQLFGARLDAIEQAFHMEDSDNVAFLFVLPTAVLGAARAERIGRHAMLLILFALFAQVVSTGIDLLDDQLALHYAMSTRKIQSVVEISELIFLELYLIGLSVSTRPAWAAAGTGTDGGSAAETPTFITRLRRRGLSPRRFYSWYLQPALWRWQNPGRTPEDYYASMIHDRITRGRFHPAIGATARAVRAPSELLDVLQAHGLQPHHTVVDYGCGSFRLGRALIEHLDPGRYWGLDVVEEFLTIGMALLNPALVAEKQPRALVINAENLALARAASPDYIVSWHVCSKVPPHRHADYFGKMISLMRPGTQLLVHFPETVRRRRMSRFSWSESRKVITAVVHAIDPSLEVRFKPLTVARRGVHQTMIVIRSPK